MATSVTFNGVSYSIPNNREPKGWGTSLTALLVSVANNALSKGGGTFTLTADIDFGASFGVKSLYFSTRSASPALSGIFRLSNNEEIMWRNAADSANIELKIGTDDNLQLDGVKVPTISSTDTQTNKTFTSPVLNTGVSGTAVLDEDNMASDSATKLATQQSIKAYTDTHAALTVAHGATGAVVGTTNSQTLTNKTLTSPVLDTSISGTAFLDEDNMASDSATKVASQQSIKAYVDAQIATVSASGFDVVGKSANYTVLDNDNVRAIIMTTGASDKTITLPTAADNSGRFIFIVKDDNTAGDVIIDGEGAETINGNTTYTISGQYGFAEVVCDGTGWVVTKDYSFASVSFSTTFSGGALLCTRVGRQITLATDAGMTHSLSAAPVETGIVPAKFRPTSAFNTIYYMNGSLVAMVSISTSGAFQCDYRDWAGSTSDQTDNQSTICISYNRSTD